MSPSLSSDLGCSLLVLLVTFQQLPTIGWVGCFSLAPRFRKLYGLQEELSISNIDPPFTKLSSVQICISHLWLTFWLYSRAKLADSLHFLLEEFIKDNISQQVYSSPWGKGVKQTKGLGKEIIYGELETAHDWWTYFWLMIYHLKCENYPCVL